MSHCQKSPLRDFLDHSVHWNGPCKDGYADGTGVFEWTPKDGTARRIEGKFALVDQPEGQQPAPVHGAGEPAAGVAGYQGAQYAGSTAMRLTDRLRNLSMRGAASGDDV
jgi:hypothetical protein